MGSILSRCDIGFVHYPVDILNNIYCASNKIYEYASVGLPILANENPTVKEILDGAHIGLATKDFTEGLRQLIDAFKAYKGNCIKFSRENPWEHEALRLLQTVKSL